jgi:hypothetical protein
MQHKTCPFESKSLQVGSSNPKEGTLRFNRTKVEFDKFLSVKPPKLTNSNEEFETAGRCR